MAAYFFDSSALVKRYVNETGSGWVQALTDSAAGHEIYVARITTVEVIAALVRRIRAGSLNAQAAVAPFKADAANIYRIIELTAELADRAIAVTERPALRGYDAVQLATGLEIHDRLHVQLLALGLPPQAFPCFVVSSDVDLNTAAVADGLMVEDPNTHP